jgi:hypothetical protein
MSNGLASALNLATAELECLKAIANAFWFSIRAEGTFEWLDKRAIRTSTIAIRSSEVILLESKDIQLSSNHEAFRISVRRAPNVSRAASEGLDICGPGDAWLNHIEVLPKPLCLDLLWNSYEYEIQEDNFSRALAVSVPDALVIQGREGKLLVSQDEAPMWLAVTGDPPRIEEALGRSERVIRIP